MPERLLEVRSLDVHYGDVQALFGVSLRMSEGDVVALVGANGAGKSTLLKCIAGAMPARYNAIQLHGVPVGGAPTYEMVQRGVVLVPEGRHLFASLTVEENLKFGSRHARRGPWTLQRVYELFPKLDEHRDAPATSVPAGAQQMAAVGRALMANPKLLLCDEPSLGLSLDATRDFYKRIPALVADGISFIIAEQDIAQALAAARHVYCLQDGRVTLRDEAKSLTPEKISAAYFGV
jgi:branched-chain amino acid transport system ATP-binding protein